MKKILLLTVFGFLACVLNAQIVTDELPYGLNVKAGFTMQKQDATVLSAPDKTLIKKEDLINDQIPGPVRYAYPVRVNYTLENSGVWQKLGDGSKIWRLKVNLPGALSTNTMYDKFWLPEGGKFFVYSEDTKQYIGAITSEYIGGSRDEPIEFATAIIYGENVVFEYYQPASVKESAIISIPRIDYGYRYVDNPYDNMLRSFGDALNCNININCPEGNNWQTVKHAIARIGIPMSNGTGWCSCALVNNTNNDYTPYVLTANHCLNGLDAVTNNNASGYVFYWEYEFSGCSNSATQPTLRTTTGATVKANHSNSDFALLLLNDNPLSITGVIPYYLGWDRSGNAGASGVGIHHPRGDVKKISATNQIQNHSGQINWNDGTSSSSNTHWDATFYNGLLEIGSSGSPLINNSSRVIGQFHGGPDVTCANTTNYTKRYGKFSYSWTNNSNSSIYRRLNYWLDPAGSDPPTLNGIGISISSPSVVCSSTNATFTVSPAPTSYTWNKSSNLTLVSSSGNTAVFKANGSGAAWVSIVSNGVEVTRKTVWAGVIPVSSITGPTSTPNGQYANYRANVPTGASPTSYQWILNPQLNNNLYGANTVSLDIAFYTAGNTYQLVCRACNECGWGEYTVINGINVYNASSYSTAYPNPVSSALTVSFNPELVAQVKSSLQTVGSAKKAKTFSLDIKLYDSFGALQRQAKSDGETVTLDVSSLSNGIYILHVHDGIASEPEVQKIIVKH